MCRIFWQEMGLRQWPSESCNKPSCLSASKQRSRVQRPKQRSMAAMSLRLPLLWCSLRWASVWHAGPLQHSAQTHVTRLSFTTAAHNAIVPGSCIVAVCTVISPFASCTPSPDLYTAQKAVDLAWAISSLLSASLHKHTSQWQGIKIGSYDCTSSSSKMVPILCVQGKVRRMRPSPFNKASGASKSRLAVPSAPSQMASQSSRLSDSEVSLYFALSTTAEKLLPEGVLWHSVVSDCHDLPSTHCITWRTLHVYNRFAMTSLRSIQDHTVRQGQELGC